MTGPCKLFLQEPARETSKRCLGLEGALPSPGILDRNRHGRPCDTDMFHTVFGERMRRGDEVIAPSGTAAVAGG